MKKLIQKYFLWMAKHGVFFVSSFIMIFIFVLFIFLAGFNSMFGMIISYMIIKIIFLSTIIFVVGNSLVSFIVIRSYITKYSGSTPNGGEILILPNGKKLELNNKIDCVWGKGRVIKIVFPDFFYSYASGEKQEFEFETNFSLFFPSFEGRIPVKIRVSTNSKLDIFKIYDLLVLKNQKSNCENNTYYFKDFIISVFNEENESKKTEIITNLLKIDYGKKFAKSQVKNLIFSKLTFPNIFSDFEVSILEGKTSLSLDIE